MERSGHGRRPDSDAEPRPHAHVLGLREPRLAGVAQALALEGMTVSGSETADDRTDTWLRKAGVDCTKPGAPRIRLPRETQLLIHPENETALHPIRLKALRDGIAQSTPTAWFRWNAQGRSPTVALGGRLATTTAAMLGWAFARAGHDPCVALRTPAVQLGGWARRGDGNQLITDWLATPADLEGVSPNLMILADPGGDPWEATTAWSRSARALLQAMDPRIPVLALGNHRLLPDGHPQWVGLREGSDWWGADLRPIVNGSRFRVFHKKTFVADVLVGQPGQASATAALLAFAGASTLGLDTKCIREALEDFAGLFRDFERRGSFRGVTLIDDGSEDAGSVRRVIDLARTVYPGRRLWVVYAAGPTVSSPTMSGGEVAELADVLAGADRLILVARGTCEGTESRLFRCLEASDVRVLLEPKVADTIPLLDRLLEPGDVLLTIGAGEVGTIADAFIRRLPRDRQAG